jgi:glycerol transport system ATP-binding protein
MIYVTHDQHEALTFADYVTVIKEGELVQNGTPAELFEEPASPFIGYFIGSPGMNVLEVTLTEEGLDTGFQIVHISPELMEKLKEHGERFQLGIRPEYVEASTEQKPDMFPMPVSVVEDTGAYRVLTMDRDDVRVRARVPEDFPAEEGREVYIGFPEEYIIMFKDDRKLF